MERLPRLEDLAEEDTLVFLGDYLDRGPDSAGVVRFLREELPARTRARLRPLRGNHEDGWLNAISGRRPEFVLPPGNGCRECMASFVGHGPPEASAELGEWFETLISGSFFPADVVAWMEQLPCWHEDEHAVYLHGGLPRQGRRWLHPSEVQPPSRLLWSRELEFFREYEGKLVVCGHTLTGTLPPELSTFTPDDPRDLWVGPHVMALDTGCGRPNGFLTAVELPSRAVFESR